MKQTSGFKRFLALIEAQQDKECLGSGCPILPTGVTVIFLPASTDSTTAAIVEG